MPMFSFSTAGLDSEEFELWPVGVDSLEFTCIKCDLGDVPPPQLPVHTM